MVLFIEELNKKEFLPVTMELLTFDKLHQSPQSPQESGYLSVADLVISHAMTNGILLVLIDSCYN